MPKTSGRGGRPWQTLRANLAQGHPPCWICHQPIDYDADPFTPNAYELDHIIPVSCAPHLARDPNNLRPAHRRCNRNRSNHPPPKPRPPLGTTSRTW